MDATRIDAAARLLDSTMTRRGTLRTLLAGAATLAAVGNLLSGEDASARRKRRKKPRRQGRGEEQGGHRTRQANVCEDRNWCLDRSHTCGPEDGYGKCLFEANGGSLCAEILFQVQSCTECEAPYCTNCRCALAAGGGGDRCNNGANGYDFICVRAV